MFRAITEHALTLPSAWTVVQPGPTAAGSFSRACEAEAARRLRVKLRSDLTLLSSCPSTNTAASIFCPSGAITGTCAVASNLILITLPSPVLHSTMSGTKAVGLPRSPSRDFFDALQWSVLLAFSDAVIAPVAVDPGNHDGAVPAAPPSARNGNGLTADEFAILHAELRRRAHEAGDEAAGVPDEDTLRAFFAERPSDSPRFVHVLTRSILGIPPRLRKKLGAALSFLG